MGAIDKYQAPVYKKTSVSFRDILKIEEYHKKITFESFCQSE